jgi:hypothetical protein
MNRTFQREFADPPSPYRGAPFWAWNGRLEPAELRWQIRRMHEMGLGGFFMHSRVGLVTPYLGEEWFACIEACVDEARRLGMKAWLYDEDRWPSGAAGGLATEEDRYRLKGLVPESFEKAGDFRWQRSMLAAYVLKREGLRVRDVRRLSRARRPQRLTGGESIVAFHLRPAPDSDWYNGQSYLDTMSPEAVQRFIEITYEPYRERFGEEFGKTIPGVFTDEPNNGVFGVGLAGVLVDRRWVPWTDRLPEVFRERYGYDLLDHLPELIYELRESGGDPYPSPARHDYRDCTTHLFDTAFAAQCGRWCEENNLLFTGHVLGEGTMAQHTAVGGSCMRFYEHMQAPGMDLLTQRIREYDTAKQVSSAARQFGRKWRLTETYGCTGWDWPLAGHKALGDWQAALGINLRCQHLSLYTMLGEAKRDYPASIFHQSPWWRQYREVEDYFARIHTALSRGSERRDVLVVYPIESMWCEIDPDWVEGIKTGWEESPRIAEMNRQIIRVRDALLAENIDFDYGDEDILARHGKVTGRGDDPQLVVGKARYRAVVLPPMRTIRGSTLDLLERFRRAGGRVVFAGSPADHVDARADARAAEFAKTCLRTPGRGAKIAEAVEDVARVVSIEDGQGRQIEPALHILREDADGSYLFVCNSGRNFDGALWDVPVNKRTARFEEVYIRGFADRAGHPLELDPRTGEIFSADARREDGSWRIRTSLEMIGSRLFFVPKNKQRSQPPARPALREVSRRTIASRTWKYSLSDPNALVLDRPKLKISGARRRAPEEILWVDRRIRTTMGLTVRGGQMVQPWARKPQKNPPKLPFTLEYEFEVKDLPAGEIRLGIERPELWTAYLNGTRLDTEYDNGWWCDKSLRTVPFDAALLKPGTNTLRLEGVYTPEHPGLEIVYLLGAFAARARGATAEMTALPESLKCGDWTRQGLAFYSGSVTYRRRLRPRLEKDQRLFLAVEDFQGSAVRVLVDGRPAGVAAWPPYEIELTELLAAKASDGGEVELGIEILAHRRNSHGPLHLADRDSRSIGPVHFLSEGEDWSDDYVLVPCGLQKPPKLIVREPEEERR